MGRRLGYLTVKESCGNAELNLSSLNGDYITDIKLIHYIGDGFLEFVYTKIEGDIKCRYRIKLNYDQAEDKWDGHSKTLDNNKCPLFNLIIRAYRVD